MSMKNQHVDQMSIGEFARRLRLSAKALRLYDELGVQPPARVESVMHEVHTRDGFGKQFIAFRQTRPTRSPPAARS